jgi:hypothetical protein
MPLFIDIRQKAGFESGGKGACHKCRLLLCSLFADGSDARLGD